MTEQPTDPREEQATDERRRRRRGCLGCLGAVLIGLALAFTVVLNSFQACGKSKWARSAAGMRSVATSLEAYCVDNETFPMDQPIRSGHESYCF